MGVNSIETQDPKEILDWVNENLPSDYILCSKDTLDRYEAAIRKMDLVDHYLATTQALAQSIPMDEFSNREEFERVQFHIKNLGVAIIELRDHTKAYYKAKKEDRL